MEHALVTMKFWKDVVDDHLHFIHENLSSHETTFLTAIDELDVLLTEAHCLPKLLQVFVLIRQFKIDLLTAMTNGHVNLHLTPTFVEHMINEIDEALEELWALHHGKILKKPNILLHKLWLTDIKGHLEAIMGRLDPTEKLLKKRVKKEHKHFTALQNKALEFLHYLKNGIAMPALETLDVSAVMHTKVYLALVQEIHDLIKNKIILGALTHEMLDHMIREQYYYLFKLGAAVDPRLFLKVGQDVPAHKTLVDHLF